MREPSVFEETLRANAAEREVARARRIQARILQMAEAWEDTYGEGGIRASVAAEVLRGVIRDTP